MPRFRQTSYHTRGTLMNVILTETVTSRNCSRVNLYGQNSYMHQEVGIYHNHTASSPGISILKHGSFQASPRFAKNAPISRFLLRGPPIPGLGNPEEDWRSIPTVCNLGPLLVKPSKVSCGAVRGGGGGGVIVVVFVVVVVGGGAAEATGDARLGVTGVQKAMSATAWSKMPKTMRTWGVDERDGLVLGAQEGGIGHRSSVNWRLLRDIVVIVRLYRVSRMWVLSRYRCGRRCPRARVRSET